MRRSLTSAETDARRLQHKNVMALWLGIEVSKRLARENEIAKTRAEHHTKEWDRAIHRLSGYISSTSDISTTGTKNDDEDPPSADAYTQQMYHRSGYCKGKGPDKKW